MVVKLKIFSFFIFFFLFNTIHIDSNSSKRLIYDQNDLYDSNYNTIYFVNANSNDIRKILNYLNLEAMTYIVEDKKYYVRNVDILLEVYTENKSLEEKLLDEINGIRIDAIRVKCTNAELIEIDKWFDIY